MLERRPIRGRGGRVARLKVGVGIRPAHDVVGLRKGQVITETDPAPLAEGLVGEATPRDVGQMKSRVPVVAHFVILALVANCTAVESIEPSSDTSACERAAERQHATCATVYEFAASCANELGRMEICVLDDDIEAAEAKYGPARWTTRDDFARLALLDIPPPCFVPGPCNALSGCWGHESCNPTVGQ